MSQLDRIEAALISVNAKLDALIDALAEEDDEEQQQVDLDGNLLEGSERGQSESLD